jgi:hypothetical protein
MSVSHIFKHGFKNEKTLALDEAQKCLKHKSSLFTKDSLDEFCDRTLK